MERESVTWSVRRESRTDQRRTRTYLPFRWSSQKGAALELRSALQFQTGSNIQVNHQSLIAGPKEDGHTGPGHSDGKRRNDSGGPRVRLKTIEEGGIRPCQQADCERILDFPDGGTLVASDMNAHSVILTAASVSSRLIYT